MSTAQGSQTPAGIGHDLLASPAQAQLLQSLQQHLQRFDDEAFAALANKGLLRRAYKDLEKASGDDAPRLTAADPSHPHEADAADRPMLVVALLGQRVVFDQRGPAQARCTCPSTTVCQHLLAAALHLKALPERSPDQQGHEHRQEQTQTEASAANPDQPAQATAAPDPTATLAPPSSVSTQGAPTDMLRDALLAITARELERHAGKPGYRWAWQFVQDLPPAQALQISGDQYLILSFSRPRLSFRYLGGGLDGLMADATISQLAKYQVAAVMAFQRAHGREPQPLPLKGRAPATQALDLGQDHAPLGSATDRHAHRQDRRARLRQAVQQWLLDALHLGLSHLSPAMQQRASTLSVWAQSADYYRLAMLLRRLADQIELLIDRAAGADEHRLLDDIAIAYALVNALDQAAAQGQHPRLLTGRARSVYNESQTLLLYGLGAYPWRSASGYVGLTQVFWLRPPARERSSTDAENTAALEPEFLTATDARPESLAGFDPRQRYLQQGPWTGLASPQAATGHTLALTGALHNDEGRLSVSEKTTARLEPQPVQTDALNPQDDWERLLEPRRQHHISLIAEPRTGSDWVVLRPAAFDPPQFDAVAQTLNWPLRDGQGRQLMMQLRYSPLNEHAIERIERFRDDPPAAGTLLVARLFRVDPSAAPDPHNPWAGEPLSLIRAHAPGAQQTAATTNQVDALHFDPAPSTGRFAALLGKLHASFKSHFATTTAPRASSAADEQTISAPPPTTIRPLLELQQWLQTQAERGMQATPLLHTAWEQRCQALADDGLTVFADLRNPKGDLPETLLRVHYLTMQMQRLGSG